MKTQLFAIAFTGLLAGCAYQPPAYQADKSEAYNIAHAGGLTQLRDYGTVDKTTGAVLDAGYAATGFINPQFGMSSMEGGAALLLGSMFSSKPLGHAERNSMIAWMPENMASNKDDAQIEMVNIVERAITDALVNDYKLSVSDKSITVSRYKNGEVVAVTVTNSDWNCNKEKAEQQCIIRAHIRKPSKLPAPRFIGQNKESYAFLSDHKSEYNSFYLIAHKENNKIPSEQIYKSISKYMPEWSFMFISPLTNIYYLDKKGKVKTDLTKSDNRIPYILKKGETKHFTRQS